MKTHGTNGQLVDESLPIEIPHCKVLTATKCSFVEDGGAIALYVHAPDKNDPEKEAEFLLILEPKIVTGQEEKAQ